jgi:hypothetical protein
MRRSGLRRRTDGLAVVVGVVVSAAALTACGTEPGDFVREGERFLESDEMARAAGYRLVGARCEQPTSVAVGTLYQCTAADERGFAWVFELEITGGRELTVQDVMPAAPASTSG